MQDCLNANCGTGVKCLQSPDKICESWNSLQILGRMKELSCLEEWAKLRWPLLDKPKKKKKWEVWEGISE